ncbi:hypothetical protein EYD45_08210 [Hyunsoonleella flava]|uniref:Uncharacterized protein n=1 Tax=Hyunsoonleella flava TaxID=2527939 RepID=A0A4Q9FJQ8_9FLAO|nr:hypothetical protein [Hyunsoonleella flava]TBN03987.1 hypothetical protein EYD45_08210 [Hyunsoonleella flava]
MKTNQLVSGFLMCFIFFSLKGYSQDKKLPYCKNKDAAKELHAAFKTMHAQAKVANWKDNKTCKAKDLISKVDGSMKSVSMTEAIYTINKLYYSFQSPTTKDTFDKGFFTTMEDKGLYSYKKSKNFSDFVSEYTGKSIGDIQGKRTSSSGMEYKDIDVIRRYYNGLKSFFTTLDFNVKYDESVSDNCRRTVLSTIKVAKFSYPNITWEIKTRANVNCVCNNGLDKTEVKSGSFEYTATTSGVLTHPKVTFSQPKDSKITINSLVCCGEKQKDRPISSEPKTEDINNLMPDQYIGGGVGFGATQDFEEISYCFFAEYLKKITYGSDDYAWYAGIEAGYSGWSFNDSNSNRIKIGPKLQYHTALTPSKQTQFVAGIMGNYNFGTTDNGFSIDDVTGIVACAYGGVNIRICENWSVFGQFPVFIYESTTFKSESGGEFKTDGTSLLINKDNPLKLGVRFNF